MNRITRYMLFSLVLSNLLIAFGGSNGHAQTITTVADGWAGNSVNAVIFRRNSIASWKGYQFIAFYDQEKNVVLGKRKLGSASWITKKTQYQGDASDAHRSISLIVDGAGYLHISWNHHGNALNYVKSLAPASLALGEKLAMTGKKEDNVTYPEFYTLNGGNLLFLYRDGSSGNGNLMINRYDLKTGKWTQVQDGLIDGEGKRNAYWQMAVDAKGIIHLSWVWRESPDVASNHDMCYARSADGGKTWEKSDGEKYQLPITLTSAEYACRIPQQSELINQTSMFADAEGHPFIATYWREAGQTIPQYHVIYNDAGWKTINLGFRKTPFSLSGAGTKSIPISRPQILAWKHRGKQAIALLFRDQDRGNKASVAINADLGQQHWELKELSDESLGSWEPSYDTELWKNKGILNLYIQKVIQLDAEGKANVNPSPVRVLEYQLTKYKNDVKN
ncbi:MAG: BNR repeat-containing protein [Pedobacter sp.]|uniref:BNR repeat-containing protein n=1 Tax=Pedobacter sp. TaxID=1411316 RepID=UPI0033957AD5